MKVTTDSCLFGAWVAGDMQQSMSEVQNVLDIGTGTALLSLMVAQQNNCTIDAIEIEHEAAVQAAENVSASPWSNRIRIIEKDIRVFESNKPYDCIISNPPFYEKELHSTSVARNTAHHDKSLLFKELTGSIKHLAAPPGIIYLLLPFKRWKEMEAILLETGLHIHKQVLVKQSAQHQPIRVMVKCGWKAEATVHSEICIRNEAHQYTTTFQQMLQPYYLYL